MVIVTPTGEQSVVCIPRSVPTGSTTLSVRSKTKNKTVYSITPTISDSNGEVTITWTPASGNQFIEDNFYYFELTEGSTLLWRGQGFCTTQTNLPKFTVNSGKFVESTANDNTFVVL
jgi:hypothetical protein